MIKVIFLVLTIQILTITAQDQSCYVSSSILGQWTPSPYLGNNWANWSSLCCYPASNNIIISSSITNNISLTADLWFGSGCQDQNLTNGTTSTIVLPIMVSLAPNLTKSNCSGSTSQIHLTQEQNSFTLYQDYSGCYYQYDTMSEASEQEYIMDEHYQNWTEISDSSSGSPVWTYTIQLDSGDAWTPTDNSPCIGADGNIYTLFYAYANTSQGLDFSVQSFDPSTGATSIPLPSFIEKFGPEGNYVPNPRYQGSYSENDQFDIVCDNQDTISILATLQNDYNPSDMSDSDAVDKVYAVFQVPISTASSS